MIEIREMTERTAEKLEALTRVWEASARGRSSSHSSRTRRRRASVSGRSKFQHQPSGEKR